MKHFKRMDSINVVPFIDVMLVLLVIVLVSATFIAQGKIPISIPKSSQASQIPSEKKSVEIAITAQGEYFLDDQKLDLAKLKEALSKLSQETVVVLRGDKKSSFEDFVALIGILNEVGHDNVDIQVQKQ